jgi:tripartite ATP-independent transporter DctM subunit
MTTMVYAVIGILLIMMILRVPLAFSILFTAIFYLVAKPLSLDIVASRLTYAIGNSFTLLAIPLFVLVGNLMNVSGITTRIFDFAKTLVGTLPGGLAHVNAVASLIFSGTSGAAMADVGGLGVMEIKAMTDAGYRKDFSAAVTVTTATVGPIFPPSIPLVIFAAVNEISAVDLLLAGILPGILTTIILIMAIAILASIRHYPRDAARPPFREVWGKFLRALPAMLAPVILIGGMVSGIFSPTESAAVAVAYVFVLGIFAYKELDMRSIYQVLVRTAYSTATILFVTAAAFLLSWVVAVERVPDMMEKMLLGITTNPYLLLLIMNLIVLAIGCLINPVPAILLFSPILLPALEAVGCNPTHVGLVFVFNLMIGLITPPVGMSLYLVSNVADEKVEDVLRQVFPFFIPLLLALFLLTYVPQISLFVPNLLK